MTWKRTLPSGSPRTMTFGPTAYANEPSPGAITVSALPLFDGLHGDGHLWLA